MERIRPGAPRGLMARGAFLSMKRNFGKVPSPLRAMARHNVLLGGVIGMERAFAKARLVPARLKSLACVRAATLIGCPF